MKILHAFKVFPPDLDGGIPQVIRMLSKNDNLRIKSRILVARFRGHARTYSLDGVAVRAVASLGTVLSMPIAPSYPFVLRALAGKADVIVHHAPFPLSDLGIALGLRKSTALVVYWHAEIVGRRSLLRLLSPFMRAALRRADKIIVSDPAMLTGSLFLKPHQSKCVVIPYGLDVEYWRTTETFDLAKISEIRQRYPHLILSVGRLVSYKGFSVLLDAVASVDNAQLVIIGEGPLYKDLMTQAAERGIKDRVFFKGRLSSEEIRQYIHACRLFVLPSVNEAEAFGLVQVEAMAAGRAVINTYLTTAVPNVARHGYEGLTVPANDSSALAAAIRTLLSDPKFAERLGRAGSARARSEFTASVYRMRVEAVFQDAIRERRKS